MAKITKSEEELTIELNTAVRKLYHVIEGTSEEKKHALQNKIEQAIQFAVENESKGRIKPELNIKREKMLKMARNLQDPKEIAEELGYKTVSIYTAMKNYHIYTRRMVVTLLASKSDQEIASEGNLEVSAVARVRQEENEKRKAKIENKKNVKKERQKKENPKRENVIRMLRSLKDPKDIAKEFGYNDRSQIYKIMKQLGIYTKRDVIKLLGSKLDQEIAIEGNLEVSAVARVRQEENEKKQAKAEEKEKRRKETKKEKSNIRNSKREKLIQMAKDLQNPAHIVEELGYRDRSSVYTTMKNLRIFGRRDVVKLLAEKTDQEIAFEGNVEVSAVARVRQEENEKKQAKVRQEENEREQTKVINKKTHSKVNTMNAKQQPENIIIGYLPKTDEQKRRVMQEQKLLRLAKNLVSIDELEGKTGFSKYDILQRLRKEGIPTRDKIKDLITTTKLSDEEIATQTGGNAKAIAKVREEINQKQAVLQKISEDKKKMILHLSGYALSYIAHKVDMPTSVIKLVLEASKKEKKTNALDSKKQVEFKITMMQFRTALEKIEFPSMKAIVINSIERLLLNYDSFLTVPDYAYIAFAYLKIGEYMKAIELGEEVLNLQEPSIGGLTQRIHEVLEEAKKEQEEKKAPPQHVGGDER